jgi:hypothetical protein
LIFFASALSGCVSTQPVSINNASVFWDMATLAYSSASTISPEAFYRLNQADQTSILLGKIAENYMPEYICKDEKYTIYIYDDRNAATKITTVTPIDDENRVPHPIYVNGSNLHTGEPFSKKFPSYNASEDQKISISPNKDISAFSILNSPPLSLVETFIKQLKEEVKCEADQIHQHIQAVVPIAFLNLSESIRNRVIIEDLSASKNVEQTLIKLFKEQKIPSRFYDEIIKTLEDLKLQEQRCKNQDCQTKKHIEFLQTATQNVKDSKESLQWYLKNTLGIHVKIQVHNLLNVMKRLGVI